MNVPAELEYNGPNRDIVREVMEFAFSAAIVAGSGPAPHDDETIITNDLVRAVDAAGLVSEESRFEVAFKTDGILTPETWPPAGEISWSDEEGWAHFRECLSTAYIQTENWYAWSNKHETEINKCASLAVKWTRDDPMQLHKHLRNIVPEGPPGPDGSPGYYREFVINEIAGDMMDCCKNRAFNGLKDNFWERLFS